MRGNTPSRRAYRSAALLAVVTALSMLAVPMCAPLCAGASCMTPGTAASTHQKESCHGGAGSQGSAPSKEIGRAKTCGLAQLPVATLISTEKVRADFSPRSVAVTIAAMMEQFPSLTDVRGPGWKDRSGALRATSPPQETDRLRI